MKQMAIYASRRGAKRMYLLYPLYRNSIPEETEVVFNIIDGRGDAAVRIPLQILQVPFAFGDDAEKTKTLLLDILAKTIQPQKTLSGS